MFVLTSLTAFLTSSSEFSFATSSSRKAWTISCQDKGKDFVAFIISNTLRYPLHNPLMANKCIRFFRSVQTKLLFKDTESNQDDEAKFFILHTPEWVQFSCTCDLISFHTSSCVNRSSKLFCSFCVWQWRVFIFLCLFSNALKKKCRNDYFEKTRSKSMGKGTFTPTDVYFIFSTLSIPDVMNKNTHLIHLTISIYYPATRFQELTNLSFWGKTLN